MPLLQQKIIIMEGYSYPTGRNLRSQEDFGPCAGSLQANSSVRLRACGPGRPRETLREVGRYVPGSREGRPGRGTGEGREERGFMDLDDGVCLIMIL